MDLSLSVKANFDEASKAFKSLADESEETRQKIEKFSDSFSDKQIDSFIDKQKMLEVSMRGTRGETASMQQAVNGYQKEIERLIKSGLDPNSEAVQKLVSEQNKLKEKIKESNEIQKAQNELMKNAEKAALACYAAIAAGLTAIVAMTQKTAEMGDEFAKSSRKVGLTAETFQELNYAAKMSGVNDLNGHLQKLQKTMIDVKNGTGTLTDYLKNNNQELLTQIQSAKNNEQAFTLLMGAIKDVPDGLNKAELAMAAFGKSGQEMVLMAENGVEGLSALREEARKYGVISNAAAKASEDYLDAQARLKAALTGVSTELTSGLLPGLTKVVEGIANFIAGVDNWGTVLEVAAVALAALTAGLTAFLVVTKGSAIVHAMTVAITAMNAAIMANPIGLIAAAIAAALVLIVVGIKKIYDNWDVISTYLQQGIARLEYAFKWLGSVIKESLVVAFNAIKIAGVTLLDFIYGNIIRGVGKLLEVMGKLPFVGEMFQAAAVTVSNLGNAIGDLAERTRQESIEAIQAAREEQNATEETLKTKLTAIDTASKARREELEAIKTANAEEAANVVETNDYELKVIEEASKEKIETAKKTEKEIAEITDEISAQTLRDRLNLIALTEQQAQNQQIAGVQQFLEQRAALESSDFEERLAFLNEQKDILLASEQYTADEKEAIEKAANEAIKKAEDDLAKYEQKLLEEKLNAFSTFFGGFGKLLDQMGQKNRGFAIAARVVASAEAAINTALAATKALASTPWPLNLVAMAGTIAAGIAQQVQIHSTPIPSAETGGRFVVPYSSGVDNVGLKVNSGETVEVTPRGQESNESFNFNFVFDNQVLSSIINKQARAGELYTLQLAGNF